MERKIIANGAALIIARLFSAKGLDAERLKKAKGMASRHKVDWLDVVVAMTPEQRQQVEALNG
jgi:hypothetical protein